MVDSIIKATSPNNISITNINQRQYASALLITNNKIIPAKPAANRKSGNGPPAWQQRLQRQIDQLRGDLSIINEHTNGNTSTKTKRKPKTIQKKYKITKEEQHTILKEDLKQIGPQLRTQNK